MAKLTIGQRSKAKHINTDDAAAIALQGLSFLASDETRIERFLALTGAGPDELRAQAGSSAMQLAVLEHLLSDESLLLVFADEIGLPPESIETARQLLAGPDGDQWS